MKVPVFFLSLIEVRQTLLKKLALLLFAIVLSPGLLLFKSTFITRAGAAADDGPRSMLKEKIISTGQIRLHEISGLPVACCERGELYRALEQDSATPHSLTVGDFDEDGVPDAVGGYSYEGRGLLVLYTRLAFPGTTINEGSLSARTSEMQVFEDGLIPDFLGVGDFDGDGNLDLVLAARAGYEIHILLGDGRGSLKPAQAIALPGKVTALASGGINLADGLADLAVGIETSEGSNLLVFCGSEGVWQTIPQRFDLPASAASILIGRFDSDYLMDVAVAAGDRLLILSGRDQRLPSTQPVITNHSFASKISSLITGSFLKSGEHELAVLTEDGFVSLLSAGTQRPDNSSDRNVELTVEAFDAPAQPGSYSLSRAQLLGEGVDNLLIVDRANNEIRVLSPRNMLERRAAGSPVASTRQEVLKLEGEDELVSLAAIELTGDTFSDLVMLKKASSAFTVAVFEPQATFTVTNTNDSGPGSLRAAILGLNSTVVDTIVFNIPGTGLKTINLLSPLPPISRRTTIDGYSQPGASPNTSIASDNAVLLIELNGANAGNNANGLSIQSTGCTIKGLIINRFKGSGILIGAPSLGFDEVTAASDITGGHKITGNFIGTNASGNASGPGNAIGIFIVDSDANTIGGTALADRNVISGNIGNGIEIDPESQRIVVQGNFIGIGANGVTDVGNGKPDLGSGVSIDGSDEGGSGNIIGADANPDGTISSLGGNVIAFNGQYGIVAGINTKNQMLGNKIFSNGIKAIEIFPEGPNEDTPQLSVASSFGGNGLLILGNLKRTPNTAYNVVFYQCDASSRDIGAVNGTAPTRTGSDGNAIIRFNLIAGQITGGSVNCQAFNPADGNDTSEYSNCQLICIYSLTPPTAPLAATAGTGELSVSATGSCNWTASLAPPLPAWLTITSGSSYSGNQVVRFNISANMGGAPRTAMMIIAGTALSLRFTITQSGSGPVILGVRRDKKHLIVSGEKFDRAVILMNGTEQKTQLVDGANQNVLKGKKLIKKMSSGVTYNIQVRNFDNSVSNVVPYTR